MPDAPGLAVGDTAPDFTTDLVTPDEEVTEKSLSELLEDSPVLLTFYTVEEVGGTDEADEEGNVAGILMRNEPLEAESIDLENALFFLLGSLGAIAFVVLALASL